MSIDSRFRFNKSIVSIIFYETQMTYLKYFTAVGRAGLINAWLIHAQSNTIEENNCHTDSFEPRVYQLVKGKHIFFERPI